MVTGRSRSREVPGVVQEVVIVNKPKVASKKAKKANYFSGAKLIDVS